MVEYHEYIANITLIKYNNNNYIIVNNFDFDDLIVCNLLIHICKYFNYINQILCYVCLLSTYFVQLSERYV